MITLFIQYLFCFHHMRGFVFIVILTVLSSFAIISLRKRVLVAKPWLFDCSREAISALYLFTEVPWFGQWLTYLFTEVPGLSLYTISFH